MDKSRPRKQSAWTHGLRISLLIVASMIFKQGGLAPLSQQKRRLSLRYLLSAERLELRPSPFLKISLFFLAITQSQEKQEEDNQAQ